MRHSSKITQIIISTFVLFIFIMTAGCGTQYWPLRKPNQNQIGPQQQSINGQSTGSPEQASKNQKQGQANQKMSTGETKQPQINPGLAKTIRQSAERMPEVEESTAVILDKDISLAVKVTGFDRLRLKKIKKDVSEEIKKVAPDHKMHITTDKKLFKYIQDIEEELDGPQPPSAAEIKSRVDKINKDMHG